MKNCEECKKPFTVELDRHRRVQRFCSLNCRNKSHYRYVIEWRKGSVGKTLSIITSGCKNRARRKGIPCDIDADFMRRMLEAQGGKCAGTGMELKPTAGRGHGGKDPYTVSIDRKDPSKGYTRDNVQLVCVIYNEAKNMYNHQDVLNMARAIVKREDESSHN